jgi:hypothetical protein
LDTGLFAKEINILPSKIEETIINTLLTLRSNGITENVLKQLDYKLRQLARNCDIKSPQSVKNYLATATNEKTGNPISNETKNRFIYAYDKYCRAQGIEWQKREQKKKKSTKHTRIKSTQNKE